MAEENGTAGAAPVSGAHGGAENGKNNDNRRGGAVSNAARQMARQLSGSAMSGASDRDVSQGLRVEKRYIRPAATAAAAGAAAAGAAVAGVAAVAYAKKNLGLMRAGAKDLGIDTKNVKDNALGAEIGKAVAGKQKAADSAAASLAGVRSQKAKYTKKLAGKYGKETAAKTGGGVLKKWSTVRAAKKQFLKDAKGGDGLPGALAARDVSWRNAINGLGTLAGREKEAANKAAAAADDAASAKGSAAAQAAKRGGKKKASAAKAGNRARRLVSSAMFRLWSSATADVNGNRDFATGRNLASSAWRTGKVVVRQGVRTGTKVVTALPGQAASARNFAGSVRTHGLKGAITSRFNVKVANVREKIDFIRPGGGLDSRLCNAISRRAGSVKKGVSSAVKTLKGSPAALKAGVKAARAALASARSAVQARGVGGAFKSVVKSAARSAGNAARGGGKAAAEGAKAAVKFMMPQVTMPGNGAKFSVKPNMGGFDGIVADGLKNSKAGKAWTKWKPGGDADQKLKKVLSKISQTVKEMLSRFGMLGGGAFGGTAAVLLPVILVIMLAVLMMGTLSGGIIGSDDGGDYLSVEQVTVSLQQLHQEQVIELMETAAEYDNVEVIYPNGSQENYKECISALTVFTANDLESFTSSTMGDYLVNIYESSHILYVEEYTYAEETAETAGGVSEEQMTGARIYLTILRDDTMCYESLASYYGAVSTEVSEASGSYTSGNWMSIVSSVKAAVADTGTGYSRTDSVQITMNGRVISVRPDCSGFVSACLLLYGSFGTSGVTSWSSRDFVNNSSGLSGFTKHEWSGWDSLQEGDIIAYYDRETGTGHVEVFAYNRGGTHYVYNCGSDSSVAASGVTTDARVSYDVYWRCDRITSQLAQEAQEAAAEEENDLLAGAYAGMLTSNVGNVTYDADGNEEGCYGQFLSTLRGLRNSDDFSLTYGTGMHCLETEGTNQYASSMDFARLVYSEHGVTLGSDALSVRDRWTETDAEDLSVGDVMLWYAYDYYGGTEDGTEATETVETAAGVYDENYVMVFIYTGVNSDGDANFAGYYRHYDNINGYTAASICDMTIEMLEEDGGELIGYYDVTGILKDSVYGHDGYFGGWTDENIIVFNSYLDDDDMWVENTEEASGIVTVDIEEYTDAESLQAAVSEAGTPEYYVGYHEDDFSDDEETIYSMDDQDRWDFIEEVGSWAQYLFMVSDNKVLPSIATAEAANLSDWGNGELAAVYHNYYGIEYADALDNAGTILVSYYDADVWSVDSDGLWTMETRRMAAFPSAAACMLVWERGLISDGTMDGLAFDVSVSDACSASSLMRGGSNLWYIRGYDSSGHGSVYMLTPDDRVYAAGLVSLISHDYQWVSDGDPLRLKDLDAEVLLSTKALDDSADYRSDAYTARSRAANYARAASREADTAASVREEAEALLEEVRAQERPADAYEYVYGDGSHDPTLEELVTEAYDAWYAAQGAADDAGAQYDIAQELADRINDEILEGYLSDPDDYYDYSLTTGDVNVVLSGVQSNHDRAQEYADAALASRDAAQGFADAALADYDAVLAAFEEACGYVQDLVALEDAQAYTERMRGYYSSVTGSYSHSVAPSADYSLTYSGMAADEVSAAYEDYDVNSFGTVTGHMRDARTYLVMSRMFLNSAESARNNIQSNRAGAASCLTGINGLSAEDTGINSQITSLKEQAQSWYTEMYGADGMYVSACALCSSSETEYGSAKDAYNEAVSEGSVLYAIMSHYGGVPDILD